MVKNTQGGSSHKSMARKQAVMHKRPDTIRISENPLECYAAVTKLLGNGMCQVSCLNEKGTTQDMICFIRGKFRSRNKKNNVVLVGSILLVGLREYESSKNKCDLLEVYDEEDMRQLRAHPAVHIERLEKQAIAAADDIEFTNDVIAIVDADTITFSTSTGEIVAFEDI